jgi:hypothetical protein
MPVLKIFGKRIGGPKEEDMSKRISKDDKIAPNFDVPKRASRVDFSEMTSRGPNMGKVNKARRMPVPMKEGEYGNVNREGNPEAIGPDMAKINTAIAVEKEMDLQDKARKSMGFKKGGSVSSASKRADGIATKGKTRGRII